MKTDKVKLVFGCCLGVALVTTSMVAAGASGVEPVAVQNLYAPKGFDDNDQVSVVLDGYLPNSCYRLDHVEKKIDENSKTITIQQFARVFPGPCLMMIIPFDTEVNLGVVAAGDYKIVTNQGLMSKALKVNKSRNPGPDDYLYAPVDEARIDRADDGSLSAVIQGRFTNTCMKFQEVKVIYSGETIEVLPIIMVEARPDCVAEETPFKQIQAIHALAPERYLLHVRSLNGRAINTVFQVFESHE